VQEASSPEAPLMEYGLAVLEESIKLLKLYKNKINCPFKKQLVRKLFEEYWLVKEGLEMGGIARHPG